MALATRNKEASMPKTTPGKPVEELNYEAAFAELERIVSLLEAEPASLEQAMSLFERGQSLVQRCTQLLEQAELKVKRLSGAGLVELEED
jgi:exodeoxyribonuclease VII small subunit